MEIEARERLEGIDLDGEPAPFPPGQPPNASDVLSAQLDRFGRDPIYEQASPPRPPDPLRAASRASHVPGSAPDVSRQDAVGV